MKPLSLNLTNDRFSAKLVGSARFRDLEPGSAFRPEGRSGYQKPWTGSKRSCPESAARSGVHDRAVKNIEALANPEALELYRGLEELRS